MNRYIIVKILSNNVILVEQNHKKYVFVGKGIGFGRKRGEIIDELKEVEQKFINLDINTHEAESFLDTVDPKIIELCKNINEMLISEFGEELNQKMNLGLIDHVNFAVKRIKDGIQITNPFVYETKLLYPEEFRLAEKAVNMLRENLKIEVPDDEIGFLALHFYGGRGDNDKMKAMANSMMMNKIYSYLDENIASIDRNSFEYKRLILHLQGVTSRIQKNQVIENNIVTKLKDELGRELTLAYDIAKIIEKSLKLPVPESEIGYIAIHVHKILNKKI